jgi:hypothetical protein
MEMDIVKKCLIFCEARSNISKIFEKPFAFLGYRSKFQVSEASWAVNVLLG